MTYESRSQVRTTEQHVKSAADVERESGGRRWLTAVEREAKEVNFFLLTIGAGVSYLIMVAFFSIGFFEITKAVLVFCGLSAPVDPAMSKEAALLEMSLKGLEFLFMAPLSFLVLGNLKRYVSKTRSQKARSLARYELANAKIPIVSLMVAVVSTDLVAKILRKDGLTYQTVITECFVIVIMTAYLLLLEKLVREADHETKIQANP